MMNQAGSIKVWVEKEIAKNGGIEIGKGLTGGRGNLINSSEHARQEAHFFFHINIQKGEGTPVQKVFIKEIISPVRILPGKRGMDTADSPANFAQADELKRLYSMETSLSCFLKTLKVF